MHVDKKSFHFTEGSLLLPSSWQDRSVIILTDGNGINLTMSREKLHNGVEFAEYSLSQIAALSQQLQNYKEISRQNKSFFLFDSIISEFLWDSPQGPLNQIMFIMDLSPDVLVITASIVGQFDSANREIINGIIKSFTYRQC